MEAFVEETNCKCPIPSSVVNLHNAHRIEMRGESMGKNVIHHRTTRKGEGTKPIRVWTRPDSEAMCDEMRVDESLAAPSS
jgi:hypothetical protein